MKSYTDLNQSTTLAEFLPHKSADQTWAQIAIAGANLDAPKELLYRHNGDMPFILYSGIGVPCWSLAALLEVLPKGLTLLKNSKDATYSLFSTDFENVDIKIQWYDNPIDACYEMIVNLHEQKLL